MKTPNLIAVSLLAGASMIAHSQRLDPRDFTPQPGVRRVTGQLLVQLKRDSSVTEIGRRFIEPRALGHLSGVDIYKVAVPRGQTELTYAELLMRTGLFEFATPNWAYQATAIPNDPQFPLQWHLEHIRAETAWDLRHGANAGQPITIAICDSGVDGAHPDLQDVMVPGFHSPTMNPNGPTNDVSGHGTAVAGIAAAIGNNRVGVCGIGWNFRIMPVRITDDPSSIPVATVFDTARGIMWAAEHGADIVNVSYDGCQPNV